MKIRNGFVSNSSTSSFVVLIDGESLNNVMSQFEDDEKRYIEIILGDNPRIKSILGKNFLVYLGESGGSRKSDLLDDLIQELEPERQDYYDDDEKREDLYTSWDAFMSDVNKYNNCFAIERGTG